MAKQKRTSKYIFLIALALALIVVGMFFALYGSTETKGEEIAFERTLAGKVGQQSVTLGTTARNIPTSTSNEGLNERYPTYGTSLADITDEEKDNILAEDALLRVSGGTYDSMDAEGNLYLNGSATGRKLYKHTSSVGMYYSDVDDNEPAVIEQVTISTNEVRNYVTGLYAPAGEVIKIEISEQDLNNAGGELLIILGQVSHRNNENNIWKARNDFSRMPIVANQMKVISTTAYVGTYLGGPIYVYPKTFGTTFTVKISGAVKYAHYIHGQTTKEELKEMENLSAPYFDFEVWDLGVRLSGPKAYANFDYDNLVKVGDLWEKICRTSRQVPCSANASISVGYVFDCFVAAGAACAFQGGHSWINAPCGWLSGALNYESMTSNGFWGIIHEFNHLYQSYGLESTKTNEVSNNATSLLSYVSYTNISAKRSEDDSTLGGDWNRYTDPSRSLRETIQNSTSETPQYALNTYADLIHSFGVDVFAKATRIQNAQMGVSNWFEALCQATNYNMTYYFEEMLHHTIGDEIKSKYQNLPMFVPVASVYQTGRNYFSGSQETFIETVRPFEIYNKTYTLNFNKKILVPNGFTFKIKNVTTPQNGVLKKVSDGVYEYTPTSEYSGTFYVELELQHSTIQTPNVTLSINIKTKDNYNLNITKYSFDSTTKYTTVEDALLNKFDGYSNVATSEKRNTFLNGIKNNEIGIVEGKIYIPEDGEYVFCLRSGRGGNTLYLSVNDKDNLEKVLSLTGNHPNFAVSGEHTVTKTLKKGDYVYFKEITLSKNSSDAYTELGWANLTKGESCVSIPAQYLYSNDTYFTEYDFTSNEIYKREYSASYLLHISDLSKQSIVEVNHSSWSESEKIDNIFDGDLNTFYHNDRNNFVSESNPFELTVDLGENLLCNNITISTRLSAQENIPCTFKLYGGTSLDDMKLLGDFTNLAMTNRKVSADFDEATIRYYKLYVTDTKSSNNGNKYVTIAQIDLNYYFNGIEKAPLEFEYFANKKVENSNFEKLIETSTFGYLIKGNGIIEYNFTGSKIMIFANQKETCKIKLTLNNKEYTIDLDELNQKKDIFSINNLDNKLHNLKIEVLEGNLYLDSLIIG